MIFGKTVIMELNQAALSLKAVSGLISFSTVNALIFTL
jgi:hypothetical protein